MLLDIRVGAIGLCHFQKVICLDQPFLIKAFRNVANTKALGNRKTNCDGIAIDQRLKCIARTHAHLQGKRTALNLVLKAVQLRCPPEFHLTVDNAALMQFLPDLTHAHARANRKINLCPRRLCMGRSVRPWSDNKHNNKHQQNSQCWNPKHNFFLEWRSLSAIDSVKRLPQSVVIQEVQHSL